MCCFLPCVKWLQSHLDTDEGRLCSFIITEIIRWIVMSIPIFLTAWRYGEMVQYTVFIPGMEPRTQYWIITTCIFVAGSLLIYLPLKIICVKYWRRARSDYRWRPSIVMYIIFCAIPCLVTLLISIMESEKNNKTDYMDEATTAVIQIIVMGLTFTEWMAKFRDEEMTFDLANAMAVDFFFAYDVIDFFMLSAHEEEIYQSSWLYVTFAFGCFAMIKYIPNQPTEMNEHGTPKGAVTCILVSMFCNDVPFVVVRITTMALFKWRVSDIIHPAKNVALIFFGITQLYIIYYNTRLQKKARELKYRERRCARRTTIRGRDRLDANVDGGNSRQSGYSNDDCMCEDEVETDLGRKGSPVTEIREAPPSQKRDSVKKI